jgi:hypothetical protein
MLWEKCCSGHGHSEELRFSKVQNAKIKKQNFGARCARE